MLPSDIHSDDKTQLITAINSEASAGRYADKDHLEGFRIGVTLEPVNTGSPWEQPGSASSMVGVGMGMTFAVGGC